MEMINRGADGAFSNAVLINIPLSMITGREPIPADYVDEGGEVKQFERGGKIKVPIEVEWNGESFVLYGGNHRLRQAEVNGQDSIWAFVYSEDSDEYGKLLREYL